MLNTRLVAIIRKEFIQIWRDPRTLMLILVIPIMQLFLLGYAASNDIRNLPLAVFDQDRGPAARALLDAYRAADYFDIAFDVDSEAQIRDLIEAGDARLGLIIPPNYSTEIGGDGSAKVIFVFDGSDPTAASTALAAAQQIGWQHATEIQQQRMSRAGIPVSSEMPLEIRTQVWYNPDLIDAYFMIPAIIGMILFAITSILTATTIVRERERGTMEQLIVTPIRPWELIVGKLLPYVILALTNAVEVLVIGSWWFDVPVRSDLWLIMLLSALFLVTSLSIGLLASTIANTQQEAMLTVWMLLLPTLFLSGFFFPLEAMPLVLQWISYVLPLRYYLVIIRSLLLKGTSVAALQNEIVALVIFGIVLMSAAAVRFRKRLD
ncbi:MAG: ABC transporter permease [Anaerolineales bacterium]|nr:ABC transporter permease [Anaerolineales bacterium]